jgi:uncharacterized protein YcaQ
LLTPFDPVVWETAAAPAPKRKLGYYARRFGATA